MMVMIVVMNNKDARKNNNDDGDDIRYIFGFLDGNAMVIVTSMWMRDEQLIISVGKWKIKVNGKGVSYD